MYALEVYILQGRSANFLSNIDCICNEDIVILIAL